MFRGSLCSILLITTVCISKPLRAESAWRPVRVARDADGWPHFFEFWNPQEKRYEPEILCGYSNLAFMFPMETTIAVLDELAANHANFTRLWIRPNDGFSAFQFIEEQKKVDLDRWNEDFFDRLNTILFEAERRGIVIEVMLWDRCTHWFGGGLSVPLSWMKGVSYERGQNVYHPDNHLRSSAGDQPIPGLEMRDTRRIEEDAFYSVQNTVWMEYQKRYMARVISELQKFHLVTVELINEAPGTDAANEWRKYMHTWLKKTYPGLLVQSESLGRDREFAAWGRDHPGLVDMTASHDFWTYDTAEAFYHNFKGVLPGCNEYIHQDLTDMARCRKMMWGLTMGGGACWVENILAPNGAILSKEIYQFFHPENDRPSIGRLFPEADAVIANDGSKYVLAAKDRSEILVYVSRQAASRPFVLDTSAPGRFRWFYCSDESDSFWGPWKAATESCDPPRLPIGLQYQAIPED